MGCGNVRQTAFKSCRGAAEFKAYGNAWQCTEET
jgi:hypothetical protein